MKQPLTRKLSMTLAEPEPPDGYESWQEYRAEQVFLHEAIEQALCTRTWEEQMVVGANCGLLGRPSLPFGEIALNLGWPVEYARGKYHQALRLLRRSLFPLFIGLQDGTPWEDEIAEFRRQMDGKGQRCKRVPNTALQIALPNTILVNPIQALERSGLR
jgi:hypothetical protein